MCFLVIKFFIFVEYLGCSYMISAITIGMAYTLLLVVLTIFHTISASPIGGKRVAYFEFYSDKVRQIIVRKNEKYYFNSKKEWQNLKYENQHIFLNGCNVTFQVISYLLATGAAAGLGFSVEYNRNLGIDFFNVANAAASLLLLGSFFPALSSILSSLNLTKSFKF